MREPAAASQHAVDAVVVHQRRRPPGAAADALREHLDHLVEVLARQVTERPGAAHEGVEVVVGPVLARRLRHDLLRQDVERHHRLHDAVEAARAHRPDQRGALDQLVAARREQAPLRLQPQRVPGAADALQERRHAARRAHLTHEVDAADVDAELQRRRAHQRLELAVLQPLLDAQAPLPRQRSRGGWRPPPRPAAPAGCAPRAPRAVACSRRPASCDAPGSAPQGGRRRRPTAPSPPPPRGRTAAPRCAARCRAGAPG